MRGGRLASCKGVHAPWTAPELGQLSSPHASGKKSSTRRPFMNIYSGMPTIAFWNLARKRRLDAIVSLIENYGVEILVVAEQTFSAAELIGAYAHRVGQPFYESLVVPGRTRLYSTFPENRFRPLADDPYVSIKEYVPLVGRSLLIVGVHLPSKRERQDVDYASLATRISRRIMEAEQTVGHDRTVVIGDFNMNPFETGMSNADGFHGVMDRRIAARRSRTVDAEERPFFYNPMWKVMGNGAAPALGTYFKDVGRYVNFYWHTFDQALLRPSLLEYFREDDLRLVDTVGNIPLLRPDRPGLDQTVSDHLPLVLNLTT